MPGRKEWDPDRMKTAVQSKPNKETAPCRVARIASVLQTNLELYLKDSEKNFEVIYVILGSKQYLSINFSMTEFLLRSVFFGLSQEDIYELALQLAKKNGIKIYIGRKSMQRKESGLKIAKSKV